MTSSAAHANPVQSTTPDLVIDVARFAATIDIAHLDPAVIKAVKTNIADTLSCALAGSSAKAIDVVSGLVKEWAGTPQADMFVFGGKYPAHHAAWVNGGMSHARDYDDTHDAAILHAGVIGRSRRDRGRAVARQAVGRRPDRGGRGRSRSDLPPRRRDQGRHHRKRLHLHVAARLLRRDGGRRPGARPDAGRDGECVRHRLQLGRRQSSGHARRLADEAAAAGARRAGGGGRGAAREARHPRRAERVRRRRRLLPRLFPRPRRCRRGAQGPRQALRAPEPELQAVSVLPRHARRGRCGAASCARRRKRPASDIKSIRVGVTAPGYQMVCVPEQVRLAPKTIVEAQFSIPYTVAASWIDGKLRHAPLHRRGPHACRHPRSRQARAALRRRGHRARLEPLRDAGEGDRAVPRRRDGRDARRLSRRAIRRT